MHNPLTGRSISVISLLIGANVGLVVTYFAMIAFVMTYAALTVEFGQEVRNDEAKVAALESAYLSSLSHIQKLDYTALGYAKPVSQVFVQGASATAFKDR